MAGASRKDWVVQIGELLRRDDLQTALETPTSIFKLPSSVTNKSPQAYSPSRLFLGPFHEFRPDLHKMEIFKLENAKEAKEKFQLPEFAHLVDQLKELDVQIRASYAGSLPMGSEPLAWQILIDGLFLLRLLGISPRNKEVEVTVDPRSRDHASFLESLEPKLPVFNEQQLYLNLDENLMTTQNEIAKDLLKLENQIPIQVLKRVLPQNLLENLPLLCYKFCSSVSPLPLPPLDDPEFLAGSRDWFPNLSEIMNQSQHLLHFFYALIFYQRSLTFLGDQSEQRSSLELCGELLNIMSTVLGFGLLKQLVTAVGLIQKLLGFSVKLRKSSSLANDDDNSSKYPSASELKRVGVKFDSDRYGTWGFDQDSATLKLPTITINDFCEVIMRNMVVFEAEAKLSPASFSHYVRLMSGLITTEKDVRILRGARIVGGNEEDVVKLFKELGNAVGVSSDEGKSSNFELYIMTEMKRYYESCWVVKAERFGKRYVCPVIQVLMLLVVVVLILIVVIRTVCDWFSCPKLFGHSIMNLGYYSL